MLTRVLTTLIFGTSVVCAQPQVVITGLQTPHKIVLTPGGNLLVSEPSMTPNAGRVSFVTRGGVRRSLIEELPSGTEVTLAGGSGPSAMALRERTLYLTLGAGDGERRGPTAGTSIHNPQSPSSPLFGSVLEIRFNGDIDSLTGTFRMTAQHQRALTDGGTVEISDGSGGSASISVLARFPNSEPAPNILYRFSSPWGLALSPDGRWLYVADASMNSVARVDTTTGRWRRVIRFPAVPNPTPVGPPMLDAVPTSVRVYGDQLLVSFLTGFPFVPGNARVLAVNPEPGTSEPFIFHLNSATDVLWRNRADGVSQYYILEFSTNQGAAQPPPGRLIRYDAGTVGHQVVAAPLITPVSMAYNESTRELFILELRGQILRLQLD
jgi:hypothetical protein